MSVCRGTSGPAKVPLRVLSNEGLALPALCPLCPPQTALEQDEWERPHSEFLLQRKLGQGFFGEVWEGLWLGSVPVAIKVIKSGG